MLTRVLLLSIAVFTALAADRDSAEWVIRKHGRVMVNGARAPIDSIEGLPAGDLRITGVDLTGTVLDPKELSHLAGLEHVRELFLPGSAFTPGSGSKLEGNEELKAIAGMKELERLQFSLHFLPYFNVTDAGLATFNGLTNLKELRCAQCRVSKRGLDPFVNLESLDMSYSQFSNDSMASLERMHNLRRLYLRDDSITDDALQHIAGLTKLEELDLYGVKLTDSGIAHLKDLKEMRKLILLGAPITDESIPVLAGMTHLRELNLYRSRITNAGLAKLATLRELAAVDLRYSRVTASGVETLRASVPSCEIEFVGAAPVRNAKGPSLVATAQKLNLEATEADDLTLQKLRNRKDIRELNLSYTTVTDAGLANLESLPNLRVLRLAGTQINGSGLANLKSVVDLDLSACPIRTVPVLPAI